MTDFMIIGAQKSATSSLQAALSAHEKIRMPRGESAWFEDPEYASKPWLSRSANDSPDSPVRGIKRPDLLCRPDLAKRVSDNCPDARFIVVLRDPVERAVSAYFHLLRHGRLPYRDLAEGMAACLSDFNDGTGTRASRSVVSFGLYGAGLAAWTSLFAREQFLVLSQPQVEGDFGATLEVCLNHVGLVPGDGRPPYEEERRNVGTFDPRVLRFQRWGHLLKTEEIEPVWGRRARNRNVLRRWSGTAVTALSTRAARNGVRPSALTQSTADCLARLYEADAKLLSPLVRDDVIYWRSRWGAA
ncbi:MAG: sulfotransferase domain-containing protein [Cryobacterium sp.]|nr:sulfotransferase domain-containing protein [Cryobacterium sp.]